jgi:hypothetical protein
MSREIFASQHGKRAIERDGDERREKHMALADGAHDSPGVLPTVK